MKRIRYAWPVFALCITILLVAMGWITRQTLRLDAAGAQARVEARLHERVRLALWRLDSAMLPIIVQESSRPWHAYSSFMPIEQAYNEEYEKLPSGSIRRPSELMMYDSPEILLHFQISPDGVVSSPQVPSEIESEQANDIQYDRGKFAVAKSRLAIIKKVVKSRSFLDLVEVIGREQQGGTGDGRENGISSQTDMTSSKKRQQLANYREKDYRYRATNIAQEKVSTGSNVTILLPGAMPVMQGKIQPLWLGNKLLLVNRIQVGQRKYLQGCWLNWETIRAELLASLDDLLPGSTLVAVDNFNAIGLNEARMATLPIRLVRGRVVDVGDGEHGSLHLTLITAWACVLLGSGCVGLVLAQAIRLTRRRGSFVTAVTHELRTPLTTFRLYCDMLAGGKVTDEKKRRLYIQRLKDESDRLSHLVENVLAYARLSKPRPTDAMEVVEIGMLAEKLHDRLHTRGCKSDMKLLVEVEDGSIDASVRVDISRLEQILLNLVDNSCKFASRATDNRIHISFSSSGSECVICIRDHGKGINRDLVGKLFRGFSRSAHQAAGEAPGIGLGLALSRQLARDMGGNLRHDPSVTDGARFVLTLRSA